MRLLLAVALLCACVSAVAAQSEHTLAAREAEDKQVRRVYFEYAGAKLLKNKELRAAMRTQADKPFKRRFFSSDLVALVNIYRGRGYRDAYIKSKKLVLDHRDRLKIYITIDSGPLWTIEQVEIEGGDPFAPAL